jgi:hypothetical protein
MRKLPYLLVLLLLSLLLLAAAASAHALTLPTAATQASPFAAPVEEETEADEEGEAEDDEMEDESDECTIEDEEDVQLCAEIAQEEKEEAEAERCVIEDADASFTAAPGAGEVRLRVHYRASEPTAVVVDASLRGNKGSLHLGSERVRFHRAGVYRYSFNLGSKQMAKAVAAKEFEVGLRAVGAPAECEMDLATRGSHLAR